ncbi:putative hydrolase [Kineococcus xinjiangensis]|uniref:Putative hydrolase n=1 Tax=Kineococcus xinjiangensis TaxID=512762 RepID=A0A2S6IWT1_9ACTN|nr:zinc-dependent metalloprotease [Kineococcus xinjiangensis]PPK98746.1 putative hydrolase [Kineococcus xinjiangensis]
MDERRDDEQERPEDGEQQSPRPSQPGFGPPGSLPGRLSGGGGDQGANPFEELFGSLFGGNLPPDFPAGAFPGGLPGGMPPGLPGFGGTPLDPQQMGQVLAQLQRFLAGSGDSPVNWDLARDIARKAASGEGDPSPGAADRRAVEDALRVAELWLDGVTELAAAGSSTESWSRADWIERTMPVWTRLVEPVATTVSAAMAEALTSQAPPELAAMIGPASGMLRQVGGGIFGMQLGQAVGALSGEVLCSTDIGLPLAPAGRAALLPANLAAFADGLEIPLDEVRRYIALREAAHARLFAQVPWLRSHLVGAVEAFARGIRVDVERISEAARDVDPANPESLQEALSSGVFEPENTPEQKVALERLESTLALVEGWVDHVVDAAARRALPHAPALRETMRRRRASGGPAEHALGVLVGLELRPRRAREAAALWALLEERGGREARDSVWQHPDLLPTAEDLAAAEGFVARSTGGSEGQPEGDAMDAALAQLLDDEAAGGERGDGGEPASEEDEGPEGPSAR